MEQRITTFRHEKFTNFFVSSCNLCVRRDLASRKKAGPKEHKESQSPRENSPTSLCPSCNPCAVGTAIIEKSFTECQRRAISLAAGLRKRTGNIFELYSLNCSQSPAFTFRTAVHNENESRVPKVRTVMIVALCWTLFACISFIVNFFIYDLVALKRLSDHFHFGMN